jgi:class 3 adenylate cyclase
VTHLVLINCNSVADWPEPLQRLTALSTLDWRLVTETLSRVIFAWENDEAGAESAAMMRSAVTPETYARYQEESRAWNVRPFLRAVRAPTLFLHARDHVNFPSEPVRRLASDIAGSRVVLLDVGDTQPLTPKALAIIGQFLGMTAPQPARRELVDGTAVIMFTDIVDSAALTERMGDGPFRAAARSLDERMRTAIAAAGGHTIEGKLLGDGVLAVFRSARAAIDAARACIDLSAGGELSLHLGLHAGDVQREGDNVFGGAVNIAARICALSEPGEILVSGTVRDLARTSAGVTFVSRGERALKGIADSVPIFAVEAVSTKVEQSDRP